MLHKMGKWLRAAGYDTLVAMEFEEDASILKRAKDEGRYLITRDRHFLHYKENKDIVIYLESNSLEECIQEISSQIKIDWLKAPFSRCLICNTALVEEKDYTKDIPEDVLASHKIFWRCPTCKKIFWEGSHTDQMLKRLNQWKKIYTSRAIPSKRKPL